MSQRVIVRILLLTVALITYFRNVNASGRRFSRNRACNLLLPPGTSIYSYIVSTRSECVAMITPLKDACCMIYDNTTRNCTIALTDRFHLVPNTSASLEVGIDKTFTTCSPNPESAVLNALPPASWLLYSRQSGSGSSLSLQCMNSTQAPLNFTFTCNPNGTWQVNESAICGLCGGGSQIFNVSGSFVVPKGVSYVRAVVVGGGGGGTNGHQPGGGGGYVNCSIVSVTSGQSIGVIVGAGGTGAANSSSYNIIDGNTAGGASSFGSYLVAGGGSSCGVPYTLYGCSGGTGSGANCVGNCPAGTVGGTGGSGGNNGTSTLTNTPNGGQGMGATAYYACLNLTKLHNLTAGAGGVGGQPLTDSNSTFSWSAGGGGGGVLLDGNGPAAQNGSDSHGFAGSGGIGFGAGGGGGGFYYPTFTYYAGGNGAGGIVYIEWD